MTESQTFPLSPASRIAIGLHILKCVLIPFVPDVIRAKNQDPFAALNPSSPVLKQGFTPDARDGLRMLKANASLFPTCAKISSQIRTLSRLRDAWGHQQALSQNDASLFIKTAAALSTDLDFEPEARCLRQLTTSPDPLLADELDWLFDSWTKNDNPSFEAIQDALSLYNMPGDTARLHAVLVWKSAEAFLKGSPSPAQFITLSTRDAPEPAETGLPGASFWWLFDLSHAAPTNVRKSVYAEFQRSLEDGC